MPEPIVSDTGGAVDEYIAGFLKTFRGSRLEYRGDYDTADSKRRQAYVAINELANGGRRVVGRNEIKDTIADLYGNDERPSNFDQTIKPALFDYGIAFSVDRFDNLSHDWYFFDTQLLNWLAEIDRNLGDSYPPDDRAETMAAYLERGTIDDEPVSSLVAWLAGHCAEYADFVAYDAAIESVDPEQDPVPKGYLLSDYLRTGQYQDDFKQYLVHAEVVGDFEYESRPLFDRMLRQQFEILQAAAAFEGPDSVATPNFEELRWELTSEEGGLTPDEWATKLGASAACFSVETELSEDRIVVSCYRGKWDK